MTKMTEISRRNLQHLGEEFERELKALGDKFGVTVKYNGGQYGTSSGVVKLKVDVQAPASGVSDQEREFRMMAHLYGLEPNDYGAVFFVNGVAYKVAGIRSRAPKRPILCERNDGKVFVFPEAAVSRALAPMRRAAAA